MAEAETLETVGSVIAFVGLILVILGAELRPASEIALESGVHNEALKELNDKLVKGEIDKKQYKKLRKQCLNDSQSKYTQIAILKTCLRNQSNNHASLL